MAERSFVLSPRLVAVSVEQGMPGLLPSAELSLP
jgi:hypothetical protein